MSAAATVESGHPVQKGTLMHFHRRFCHLNFDKIQRLERTPRFVIELNDHETCIFQRVHKESVVEW